MGILQEHIRKNRLFQQKYHSVQENRNRRTSWRARAFARYVTFSPERTEFCFAGLRNTRKEWNYIMIILGVDPGFAIVGYGVLEYNANKFKVLEYGAITTTPDMDIFDRFKKIHDDLDGIVTRVKPDFMSIEELFFNSNQKTAINVAQARGVLLLAALNHDVRVFEYTPLQVKQAVVGYGRADKNQVQQMVKIMLNLEKVPKPDDTADALAIAICHAHSYNPKRMVL